MLPEWTSYHDTVNPSAIIFHVPRCGSTLLSQLLCLDDRIISLSEVPVFDDILRLRYKQPTFKNETGSLLSSAIQLYGQKRSGNEQYLMIKTDSWHVVFWKEFRNLYPNVPFILLYRDPFEVLRSHCKHRGMHAVQGVIERELFEFPLESIFSLTSEVYLSKVLNIYLSSADKQKSVLKAYSFPTDLLLIYSFTIS